MTLEEKIRDILYMFDQNHKLTFTDTSKVIVSICQQEIDEACKKAKIEENERWKLLAEKDEVDCHESFFISRISELWENAPSPKESE